MKKNGRLFVMFLTALMALGILGVCPALADDDVKPAKVMIQKSSMTVYQGEEFEIKARITPKNADDDYLRWEILSGGKYVKFEEYDRSGDDIELRAVKPGKARIRCYVKGKNKKKYGDVITVTVKKRKADYSLSRVGRAARTVEAGDDFELEVKHGYSIQEKQLKWKISNTKVVGFDDADRKGEEVEFRAKKPGTAKITCTYTDKKGKSKKVTFTVRVIREREDDWDDDDDD